MNLHNEAQRRCHALLRCQCRSGCTYWNAPRYALLIHSSLLLPSHSHSAVDDIKANETEANGVNGNVNGYEAYVNGIPARSFENKHRGTSSSSILLIPAEAIKADITSAEPLLINTHGHGMSSSSLLLLPPKFSCGDIEANATGAAGVKPAQVAIVSITKRGTSSAL